jgi:hypothetical protein
MQVHQKITVYFGIGWSVFRLAVFVTLRNQTGRGDDGSANRHLGGGAPVGVEFPSMDIATAWYQSPAYAALKKLRMSCSEGRAFIVEGF